MNPDSAPTPPGTPLPAATSPTIQGALEAKGRLEATILAAIKGFERDTRLYVESVNLTLMGRVGVCRREIGGVELEVRL